MAKLYSRQYELAVSFPRDLLLHRKVTQHRINIHYPRRLQTKIRAMTTVLVVLRQVHHPGSHGIKVDVPDQLGQIPITLTEDCFMSSLKQMPHSPMPTVIVLAVPGENPVHDVAQGVGLALD